jgi:hypothetical protein
VSLRYDKRQIFGLKTGDHRPHFCMWACPFKLIQNFNLNKVLDVLSKICIRSLFFIKTA